MSPPSPLFWQAKGQVVIRQGRELRTPPFPATYVGESKSQTIPLIFTGGGMLNLLTVVLYISGILIQYGTHSRTGLASYITILTADPTSKLDIHAGATHRRCTHKLNDVRSATRGVTKRFRLLGSWLTNSSLVYGGLSQ